MGQFIAKHFKPMLPLLERLVVRSGSNLETWKETLGSTKDYNEFDEHALGCLKYLKDLLISKRLLQPILFWIQSTKRYFRN
jgi:hypothetical protein